MRLNLLVFVFYWSSISCLFAGQAPYSAFTCSAKEGDGKKGDLNWWFDYSYRGYKWIDCLVKVDAVKITSIKINGGNCSIVDNWTLDRDYYLGDTVSINHTCLDPVLIELTSNGKTSLIQLK